MEELDTIFSRISLLITAEKYTEALALCEQNLLSYENNAQLHYLRAFIMWQRNGFYADGEIFHKEIERALQLNPLCKEAYILRAEMFLRMGLGKFMPLERLPFSKEYYAKQALWDYGQALRIDPTDSAALRGQEQAQRLLPVQTALPEEEKAPAPQSSPLRPDQPDLFSAETGAMEIEEEPRTNFKK